MFRHHLGALALLAAFATAARRISANRSRPRRPGGAAAPAPPQQQRHHRHRNRYMHAMRSLNLSDAQKQQIAGIMKNARAANKNADPQTRRANRLALRQQIDGVLTPDQRTQLHAKLAQRAQQCVKPNGPAPQAPPQ